MIEILIVVGLVLIVSIYWEYEDNEVLRKSIDDDSNEQQDE